MIGDNDRANYAYALAKSGRYQDALDVLNTLKNPNTAVALNYRVTPPASSDARMKASATI
ncbi:Uncharacterised protein [Serratia plymuthica]|uniref:Cellulose synthase operon protein C n=1 Tax=Serratia plymuthica TaxID=82996 RepID=A0A2X4VKQ5_SERPL|nr:Uncharacterised protein [Serratia plymuthica]